MTDQTPTAAPLALASSVTGVQIAAILRERGWLDAAPLAEPDAAIQTWLGRAAELLGPHAHDRTQLTSLLALVFRYDASTIMEDAQNQAVLAREGAREVVRELANRILAGGDLDSDRLKEIVEGLKAVLPYRSRAIFHPLRVALAGRAGHGELDRVILLLDSAARLSFTVAVKSTRQRTLEFCAALD